MKIHTIHKPGNLLRTDLTAIVSSHMTLAPKFAEMLRLCKHHHGIGLAANQIGLRENVFVIAEGAKVPTKSGKNHAPHLCINPSFTPAAGAVMAEAREGCLSIPDQLFIVGRWSAINAKWISATGTLVEKTLKGMAARVFQHEHAHLRGLTLIEEGRPV